MTLLWCWLGLWVVGRGWRKGKERTKILLRCVSALVFSWLGGLLLLSFFFIPPLPAKRSMCVACDGGGGRGWMCGFGGG